MYNVQQCKVYIVDATGAISERKCITYKYNVKCIVYSVYCIMYNVQCILLTPLAQCERGNESTGKDRLIFAPVNPSFFHFHQLQFYHCYNYMGFVFYGLALRLNNGDYWMTLDLYLQLQLFFHTQFSHMCPLCDLRSKCNL